MERSKQPCNESSNFHFRFSKAVLTTGWFGSNLLVLLCISLFIFLQELLSYFAFYFLSSVWEILIPGTRDAIFHSIADKSWRGWGCLLPLKLGITREAVDFIHFVTGQGTKMKTIASEHVSVCCSGRTCTEVVQEVITIRWVWQHEWPNLFWRQVTVQLQLNSTKRWLSLKIFSSSICRLKFIQWCLHSIDVRICRFHNCVACAFLCQVHLVCNSGKAKWPKERKSTIQEGWAWTLQRQKE